MIIKGPILDLYQFGHAHSQYRKHAAGKPFAWHITDLSVAVVSKYEGQRLIELRGIQMCIEHQLSVLGWDTYFLGIKTGKTFLSRCNDVSWLTYGLPASLLATVIMYRTQLNERHTGLDRVVAREINNGLEWACLRSAEESWRINDIPKKQHVTLISPADVEKYIDCAPQPAFRL